MAQLMNQTSDILTLRDLHAGYGAARILHGVSATVKQGSLTALIGANGAGKTTLMRSLCGLVPATSGTITFAGQDVTRHSAHERIAAGLALSPEGRMIFPSLTVEENLHLGAMQRQAWPHRHARMREAWALFPRLFERRKLMAGALSGGEQQMLAVGRALMSRPRLLLLDEPTLGLAPVVVQEIFALLKTLAAQGLTLLLAEQNVQRTLEMADWAWVLEHGQIVMQGPGAQLLHDPAIRQAYLGG